MNRITRLSAVLALASLLLTTGCDSSVPPQEANPGPFAFQRQEATNAPVVANNGPQFLKLVATPSTMRLEPGLQAEGWSLEVGTSFLGREGAGLDTTVQEVAHERDRLRYRRTGFVESFVNAADGVEQTWVLQRAPAGKGALVARVAFEGLEVTSSKTGEIFLRQGPVRRLRYHGLHAFDADGATLPATMEVENSWSVRITVDDTNARYPVTIDPTLARVGQHGGSDTAALDRFGAAVAVRADVAAVGAPEHDAGRGAVYVFRRDGSGVWSEAGKLSAADATAGARFGAAVALADGALVVGAPGDDAAGTDNGAGYVFTPAGNSFAQVAKLVPPSGGSGALAGTAVAVGVDVVTDPMSDVTRAFIGAPSFSGQAAGGGAVFAFARAVASPWIFEAALTPPTPQAGEATGTSLALEPGGFRVFAGAPGHDGASSNGGAVHLFAASPNPTEPVATWAHDRTITSSTTAAGDGLGTSISLSGAILAAGAPSHGTAGAVFRFGKHAGGADSWGLINRIVDPGLASGAALGTSVHEGGAFVVAGAPEDRTGKVVFFGQDQGGANAWGVINRLSPPSGQNGDEYGKSLAMSGALVVGAPAEAGEGQIHIYNLSGEIVAVNDSYTVTSNGVLSVSAPGLLANDIDPGGNALSAVLETMPGAGSVTLYPSGSFQFTPSGATGTVTFTYSATNGTSTSAPATVSITVVAANQPPQANNDVASTARDTAVIIDVLANDSDPESDVMALESVTTPGSGTAVISSGKVLYTPNGGFSGQDTFYYVVKSNGGTDNGTVTVNVTSANQPPIANMDTVATDEEVAVTLRPLDNDTDPEDDALTLVAVDAPTGGTATVNGSTVEYTPNANFAGFDTFGYTISDSAGNVARGTLRVAVSEVRDAPVARDDAVVTNKGAPILIDVLANDSDADSTLTVVQTTVPANGTATISGRFVEYTPGAQFFGNDSFGYTVTDGSSFATANVTVTVADTNLAPRFVPPTPLSTIRKRAGEAVTFRVSAVDDDAADVITFGMQNKPSSATLDPSTGAFNWITGPSDAGIHVLYFTATDQTDTAIAEVLVELSFDDADADGVSDDWEEASGLDTSTPDSDGDTIVDLDEVGPNLSAPYDSDDDGTLDALDDDSDGDGILDAVEAGDTDLATQPVDTDADGTADARDTDSDDDTAPDATDNCLLLANAAQADIDADGRGDACDPDSDGDGVPNDREPPLGLDPVSRDSDADGIGDGEELGPIDAPINTDSDEMIDALDEDSDDDGIDDVDEAGDADVTTPAVDSDDDGTPDYRDTDSDGDGVADGADNCRVAPNGGQEDADGNGAGDACDAPPSQDADDDGVLDDADNCPATSNADQTDADADAIGDACDEDDDADEVLDGEDNCPAAPNPEQTDADEDGTGDACDDDRDNDGVADDADNCPDEANEDQADTNEDGTGDACAQESIVRPPGGDNEKEGCCRVVAAGNDTGHAPLVLAFGLLFGWIIRRRPV